MHQPTIPIQIGPVLRPWTLADAPAVFVAFGDPDIRKWHLRSASSPDEVENWINSWVADWSAGRQANWAVADPTTNELLGRVSLKHIEFGCGQAELAYWTIPARRGHGVATQAVEALTAWALREIGFHRLELTHSVHNAESCRVAVRNGFDLEGPNARRGYTSTDGTTCTCMRECKTTNPWIRAAFGFDRSQSITTQPTIAARLQPPRQLASGLQRRSNASSP